jgi:hypothetical protein
MHNEEIVKIGDAIECFKGHSAIIEKIKIISTGEFVQEYKYDGNGYDIMLILKDNSSMVNICFKDAPKKL